MPQSLDLPNARFIAEGLVASGQPSSEQLGVAAAAGTRTIVDLCMPGERGWNESVIVEGLGMRYVSIPVSGTVDVTEANARRLHALLEETAGYPMVVHCRSGNRVGALYALAAFLVNGCDLEDAVEKGRLAGLAGLEAHVRQYLSRTGRLDQSR